MKKIRWDILLNLPELLSQRFTTHVLVIVGLGNPGAEYVNTRHNVGFWCVDHLAGLHSVLLSRRNRLAVIGDGTIEGHRVAIAKPRTYMNLSGNAVAHLLARYRVQPQALLVIYDDMELPLGKLRLKPRGSAGGHKGIKSIIDSLGTQEFPRLKIGIGPPASTDGRTAHVLGEISPKERVMVEEAIERTAQAVTAILSKGIDATMNRFN